MNLEYHLNLEPTGTVFFSTVANVIRVTNVRGAFARLSNLIGGQARARDVRGKQPGVTNIKGDA